MFWYTPKDEKIEVELSCFYTVGNTCSFWQHVEALLSVLQDIHNKGSNCVMKRIDITNAHIAINDKYSDNTQYLQHLI